MGGSFARAQLRRRISDMLSGGLDRSLEIDRRFFERFPERRHRVRLATQSEVEGLAVAYGAKAARLQAGERWYAVVRWLSDGAWLKAYIPNRAGEETDVPEAWAALLYSRLAARDDGIADLETATRRIAAMGGRA